MVEIKHSPYDEESSTESDNQEPVALLPNTATSESSDLNLAVASASTEEAEGFTIVSGLTTDEPLEAELVGAPPVAGKSLDITEGVESHENLLLGEEDGMDEEEKKKRARTVGAGVAAGVLFIPFGLLPAVAIGLGAAYGTKQAGVSLLIIFILYRFI